MTNKRGKQKGGRGENSIVQLVMAPQEEEDNTYFVLPPDNSRLPIQALLSINAYEYFEATEEKFTWSKKV